MEATISGTNAVRAGVMFDGTRQHGPSTVLIHEGRIIGVETGRFEPPHDVPVLDFGADAFLMPGLIDAHTHLVFDASATSTAAVTGDYDRPALLDRMRATAASVLRAGITTVRDLGDRDYVTLQLRAEFAERPERGPHLLTAGPPLTTHGGHCYFLGGEATGDDLAGAIRERYERGCDVVKIMASGGQMTQGSSLEQNQYSAAELATAVETAHRLGMPVAAHAHGVQSIRDAVVTGVDFIEHCSFLRDGKVVADADLLDAIAAAPTVVSGTFGFSRLPEGKPGLLALLDDMRAAFAELARRDARVVVGTDGGVSPIKPHDVLPYAVADDLRQIGFTPEQALAVVTSRAADALGLGWNKGRISEGADADLLVVSGSPLADPARLRDVRAVFRSGIRVR
ncbi:amidohydrolase family protein [Actinoplanes sp. NPDC089786]|uniref:amidohydrolase family protein n=1 Tax=Actinoplanes sp. NPDC089786 TaxID=3155185 RepID=UPI00343E1DC0